MPPIVLKKVQVHNLKNVNLTLEPQQLIVFTGVSGSGKSSLAFDTIYVEGQRRYIESLSTYARRHLGDMPKPDAELISGISPTIAIEQKTSGRNPRSTVGTMTGIYDFLRVLYARIGIPHCPVSKEPVSPQSTPQILHKIWQMPLSSKLIFLSPYARAKKAEFKDDFAELLRKGFMRIRLDGKIIELSEAESLTVDGNVAHDVDLVVDRLSLTEENRQRIEEATTSALENGQGVMSILNVDTQEEILFSQHAFSKKSGLSYPPLEPQDFSFNHPIGMCPACLGLGILQEFDLEKIIDPKLSIAEDCCSISSSYQTVRYGNIYSNLARIYGFKVTTPWEKLSEKAKKVFLYGTENKWTKMHFIHPEKGSKWTEYVQWKGVLHEARERYLEAKSDTYRNRMQELMHEGICSVCQGARIKPYPAATLLHGKKIAEVTALSISETLNFFHSLKLTSTEKQIANELLKEITERLVFLNRVGLHYLALDRTAPTLSGGEAQRVRLASQIGAGLVGATYVLDEPSIGLHPRDNHKLLETLKALRDKGNTVIIVEHDEETIREADFIVDVGPLAGEKGGEIVAQGNVKDILHSKSSLTGAFLSGHEQIEIPKKRRKISSGAVTIQKATHHNLKGITVKFPLKTFIAVTGVSGSGKSSLVTDILYPALSNQLLRSELTVGKHQRLLGFEHLDKVIAIDQTPIGRTPRSNPATYIKLFDEIRELFSQLPESQAAGYSAGRFSFNVKEGSCPHCGGMGMTKIDMDFLEDEWVNCTFCKGKRFDEKTLSITYKGKNIHDILEMPVSEAAEFFSALSKIKEKLDMLLKVGLDYLRLGQPSPTLSGGEAQRIKLAKELSRPETGKTFYILDEPTTGLHFYDIKKLIHVLQALVDKGNTVLVIEHNTDLIKTADWIIDLGPEGGSEGGKIIAEGQPEEIAKLKTPTGIALKEAMTPISKRKTSPKAKASKKEEPLSFISVKGAEQNNLKSVSAHIPHGKITLCTGPSGSGKSSFAFETLYAEGQRRYTEAMSAYARQFIKQMPKPKIESIDGLSASIAIEQKSHAGNPRSTIGTMTEAYDFLRILFAHLGTAYCPETKEEIRSISKEYVVDKLLDLPPKTKLQILSPFSLKKSETFEEVKERLVKQGFLRIRLNKTYFELDQPIPFDKCLKNELFFVIDRIVLSQEARSRLFEAVSQASSFSNGTLVVDTGDKDLFFNLSFAVLSTGKSYPPITPHTFSFNTAQGMCLDCLGLGVQYGADLTRHKETMELTPLGLAYLLWQENASDFAIWIFSSFLDHEEIDERTPLKSLPPKQLQILLNGSKEDGWITHKGLKLRWIGLNAALAKAAKSSFAEVKASLLPLLDETTCFSCQGSRLNPLARNVLIQGKSIVDVCAMPVEDAFSFIASLKISHDFLDDVLDQLKQRLQFLDEIGLGYLSLNRSAPSLSGGEAQRIRLSRQLGGGLTGCLYVLDEPTIGLHPHDNELLNNALKKLCKLGNTLVLVEHDPLTVEIADFILDFGPAAGKHGGKIMAQGSLEEIKANPLSLTGAFLSGRKKVPLPPQRRAGSKELSLKKASLHNLKNIDVNFKIGAINCLTGVSGSGKSTLMGNLLRPAVEKALSGKQHLDEIVFDGCTVTGISHFDKLLVLDQNPLGHTQRSDVSTYVDLLTSLRTFFASLPLAIARGLSPKYFSFNHRKGMCTHCFGLGMKTVQLQFLPPVKIICEACRGFRLNPLSLQVTYKGKHLGHLLHMTIEEAKEFLLPIPKATRILDTLIAVGLGYLQLGQEIATLSGGEAQRLRLSRELAKRSTGKTLYLLDEPTIGLHSEDIIKLLHIFHSLADKGNTLILIEHNLDVISNADHIIDLGPGAGIHGGKLIISGTPEEVASHPTSYTAKYLAPHLEFLSQKKVTYKKGRKTHGEATCV
jgi:excinuclease ABC subunit A